MKKEYLFPFLCVLIIGLSAVPMGCDTDILAEPELDFCDSLQFNMLTYDHEIKTIIDTKCASEFGCHRSSNGIFISYGGVLPFLEDGGFNEHIFVLGDMPPPDEPSLTQSEKDKIKCWLNNGYPEN